MKISVLQLCSSFTAYLCIGIAIVNGEAQRQQQHRIKIIQLGDSFSAGNGFDFYEHDGWYGPKWCYRNTNTWGQQAVEMVRAELDDDTVHIEYSNHACANSKIQQITSNYTNTMDCGHEEDDPQLTSSRKYLTLALNQCEYTLGPQIENVDQDVDVVLVGLGGNDANFVSVVRSCFVPLLGYVEADCDDTLGYAMRYISGSLSDAECSEIKSEWDGASCSYENDLTNVLETIIYRMKDGSKLIYNAYPHLVLDREQNEYQLLREITTQTINVQMKVVDYLNAVLQSSGKGVDIVLFTENVDAFAGHEAEIPSISAPINFESTSLTRIEMPFGITFQLPSIEDGLQSAETTLDKTNPDGWYNELSPNVITMSEDELNQLYHPNADGHQGWAVSFAPTLESVVREVIMAREEESNSLPEMLSMSMP